MTDPTVRILLSKAASDALTEAGEDAFTIVCRSMRSEEPGSAGRWEIHLAPVSFQAARDACDVLMGTHRATKMRSTTKAPSA